MINAEMSLDMCGWALYGRCKSVDLRGFQLRTMNDYNSINNTNSLLDKSSKIKGSQDKL